MHHFQWLPKPSSSRLRGQADNRLMSISPESFSGLTNLRGLNLVRDAARPAFART